MRPFGLIERESSPGSRRIRIEGELDLAVAERLRQALRRAAGSRRILIDLEGCDFLDLAAVTLLVSACRDGRPGGCWVTVHGARGQPLRLLAVMGLDGHMGWRPQLSSDSAPVRKNTVPLR
jgi:anti-anti-sigma factor